MDGFARDVAMAGSIVERAATGDAVAFARIVAAYHADMVRVAFVVSGGSQDVADDAVQAAWATAWRKLRSLRDPERIRPWLVAIAANEARGLCRRQRMRSVVALEVGGMGPGAARHEPVDPAEPDPADRTDVLDLEDALRHLTPDERALLALRYEAGLDSSEIGRLLGRPAATVRWRLSRLVTRLRKELSDA
jgi:RNA polymerase sigma factor (sigma-70 family)